MCQNDMIFPRTVPEPVVHWLYFQSPGGGRGGGYKPRKQNAVILPVSLFCALV